MNTAETIKLNRLFQKMFLFAAAAAALCFLCLMNARADDSITLGMDQYRTENGKIFLYVNHNKGGGFQIDKGESRVVIGKQNLPIETIKTFRDASEPVSYMVVVDISGSMSKDRIDTVKETLRAFLNSKRSDDNVCISTMGDELVSSGFSKDVQTLLSFVDGIKVTGQDTDLYKSIKEELNVLKTDKSVHEKRCLVIFSDGADDQKDGITQSEAETQAKDSHIPVFTVALLPAKFKDADIASAKILGSFARYSAGGQHYVPQVDGFDCRDVFGKIRQVLDDSLIVSADLASVTAQDGNIYLGVEFSAGQAKGKDGMQIPVGDILEAIKKAQSLKAQQESQNEPKVEEPVAPAPKKTPTSTYILIGGAIAALIIIAIVVILMMSNKKKEEETYSSPGVGMGMSNIGSGVGGRTIGVGQSVAAPTAEREKAPSSSGVKVTLHRVGPGANETYPLTLDAKRSIGRKKSCDLSFEGDTALSGVHCYIFSKGKKVYVQDNKSTNGTFVNGVPISGEFAVESGDILLAGSAEYRIVQM